MGVSRYEMLGFCDLQEIQNVFTSELQKIDDDIRRNGPPTNHRLIIEWVDNIRLLLIKRAKHNLTHYLSNNPEVKAQIRLDKVDENVKAQAMDYKERIAKSREKARLGEG
jgi:hypothetical protein